MSFARTVAAVVAMAVSMLMVASRGVCRVDVDDER